MYSPKEFYKKRHPDRFSDTIKTNECTIPKEMVDYYLNSLTSRSEEFIFQEFCRELAQREICPNLIPQTGPVGGGDSKVDTETYPVSEQIALTWFGGFSKEAADERWAFAMSATKGWKAKVKADIKKAIETQREYKRFYFFTNQYIKDKTRAETEAELCREYSIPVNICDKTWILEKLYNNNHLDLLVKHFNFAADHIAEKEQIGTEDLKRKREMEKAEKLLKNNSEHPKKLIESARICAYLSRELELPYNITSGHFKRLFDLVYRSGIKQDVFDCLYDWAFTAVNWYDKHDEMYVLYIQAENHIKENSNFENLSDLTNLWMYVIPYLKETGQEQKEHTQFIVSEYEKYIGDIVNIHTAFNARARYIGVKFVCVITEGGDAIAAANEAVNEYISVMMECANYPNFDALTHIRLILENNPFYEQASRFDELFDIVVKLKGDRKQEVETARILVSRAKDLIGENSYKAIKYLGQALLKLFKSESISDFIKATTFMGFAFEDLGLNWAARQYYMVTISYAMEHYYKLGEMHPAFFLATWHLKYLEIRLGRVLFSSEIHKLDLLVRNFEGKVLLEEQPPYDVFLSMLISKASFEQLKHLERLPDYFATQRLDFPEIMLKYLLGYYDEDFLRANGNRKDKADEYLGNIYYQPCKKEINADPFFGIEETLLMKTKIMGCEVFLVTDNNIHCIELSSAILGGLESALATGIQNELYTYISKYYINVKSVDKDEISMLSYSIDENDDSLKILVPDFSIDTIQKSQESIQEFIVESVYLALFNILNFDCEKRLEKMIVEEKVLDRSVTVTANFYLFYKVLGESFFEYKSIINSDYNVLPLQRDCLPIFVGAENDCGEKQGANSLKDGFNISREKGDFDLASIKHSEMAVDDTIDVKLWDKAGWKAVGYLHNLPAYREPPCLILVFSCRDSAEKIFNDWIKSIGEIDKNDKIIIALIKGINKNRKFDYRAMVSGSLLHLARKEKATDKNSLLVTPTRMHTMNAESDKNIKLFEESFKLAPYFIVMPGIMDEKGGLCPMPEYIIKKSKESLTICHVQDINEDSQLLSGIMPEDDPDIEDKDHCVFKHMAQLKNKGSG